MSNFNTHAKIVRNRDVPFFYRRSAFRSCIQLYRWLIGQKFQVTYLYFADRFGFDSDAKDIETCLDRAMDALELERNLFLERLRAFDRQRIEEKKRGRRSPSKQALEILYQIDRPTDKNMKSIDDR